MSTQNKAYIDKIRKQVSEITGDPKNSHGSVSGYSVARGIGRSPAAVNQFMNDKYEGDNLRLAREIESWIKRQEERKFHEEVFTETVDTFAIRKVKQACRIAHIEGEMVVITGDSGVGKTEGVHAYAAENPDVMLVKVIPCYTAKYLMRDIHKLVGFNGKGTVIDMFGDVAERLTGSERLLIVDEAEHLPYKALELLRRLYDLSGIGVALAGMPQLISNMRGNKGEYKQIYSRIAVHAEIPSMESKPEDVQALIHSVLPNSNGVWKHFHETSGNARQLEKLVKRSIQLADRNDRDVDAEIIREAKKLIIV